MDPSVISALLGAQHTLRDVRALLEFSDAAVERLRQALVATNVARVIIWLGYVTPRASIARARIAGDGSRVRSFKIDVTD